jgi:hypothetical protein
VSKRCSLDEVPFGVAFQECDDVVPDGNGPLYLKVGVCEPDNLRWSWDKPGIVMFSKVLRGALLLGSDESMRGGEYVLHGPLVEWPE